MAFKTELLYYNDPYKIDFSSSVLSVNKDPSRDNCWNVILDKTYFYPEGGGQPSDTGTIDGIKVEHVFKKDGEVLHRMISSPDIGNVNCKIDWEHRFDFMQQHTGQHILSGALYKLGFETVSVHQGESVTTIEIDKSDISEEDLQEVETLSNSIISQNIKLNSTWVSDLQLDELSLRRKSKVSGNIRIVRIGDFDQVACGGVHTVTTGEVQCVKSLSVEKIRSHARISWKIGNRILKDYANMASILSGLSSTFSAKQSEIPVKVEEMLNSFQENKRLYKQLEERFISFRIKDLFSKTEKINDVHFLTDILENESKDYLRNFIGSVKTDNKYLICLINNTGTNFQWILASGGIDFPFSNHKQYLLSLIDARGGGKAPVWQGVADNSNGVASFFEFLKTILKNT